MKVTFDHHAFCLQAVGGISRYVCELASGLGDIPGVAVRVAAPVHRNDLLAQSGLPGTGVHLRSTQQTYVPLHLVNWAIGLSRLGSSDAGIVHETYYQYFPTPGLRGARVATVHDMIHELFPRSFAHTDTTAMRKRRTVERADVIVCVSNRTREDLRERLGVPEDRLAVVHHGCSPAVAAEHAAPPAHASSERPFVLYVGARRGYKNFDRLLRAYASSRTARGEVALRCVGGGAFTTAERETLRSLGLGPDDVAQREADDRELARSYAHARALVVPSLYEGFGMPVLEAMAHGCPVASSTGGALPEVAGDAAELFDPTSIDAVACALERICLDEPRRAELGRRGLARAASFSWRRCAADTLAVYRAVGP